MRLWLLVLLLAFAPSTHAVTYFLAANGNDALAGTSQATAWRTIDRLNLALPSMPPGSTVRFKRGDVFIGQVDLPVSGSAGAPITFNAYGAGDPPEIRGTLALSTWTLFGPNVWRTAIAEPEVRQLFEGSARLPQARYPNSGYLRVDADGTSNSFTDGALAAAAGYFVGSQVVMQSLDYAWQWPSVVASTANGTITVAPDVEAPVQADQGYFLVNKRAFVDQPDEWFFDAATQYLYLYATADPSARDLHASVHEHGIKGDWNRAYITVTDLVFFGQREYAIWLQGATAAGNIIANCTFLGQGASAVALMGTDLLVQNCSFTDVAGVGVEAYNAQDIVIENNLFKRIGLTRGLGNGGIGDLMAIRCWGGNGGTIRGNIIDSTGYCGTTVNMANALLEHNVVTNTLLIASDGGAMYSYSDEAHDIVYRENIVGGVRGTIEARPPGAYFIANGLYMDNYVYNATLERNTVYDVSTDGIVINAGAHDNTIVDNVVYNTLVGLNYADWLPGNSVYGNSATGNTLYADRPGSVCMRLASEDCNYNSVAVSDGNRLCNPYGNIVVERVWCAPQQYTLAQWQNVSGLDGASIGSFHTWTPPTDYSRLITNPTNSTVTVTLIGPHVDLDNAPITSVTLGPYRSQVVIAQPVSVRLKIFLEGAYDGGNPALRDDLRTAGLVPLEEPYSELGYAHTADGGGERTTSDVLAVTGADAVVDWLVVEARSNAAPYTLLASRSALLQRDGDIVEADGASPVAFPLGAGTYRIAVRHRNHLGTMSGSGVALSTSAVNLNFTLSTTLTYGVDAQRTVGANRRALWAGNTQADGTLKYTGAGNDRDPILVRIGGVVPSNSVSGYWPEDVNLDGVVKYTGAGNDRDPILVNVGGTTPTNVRQEQLP